MAVRIRLARYGAKKKPFYRVVATPTTAPRDGRFLDVLGTYDPRNKPSGLKLNVESVQKWIEKGAELSDTVRKLFELSKKASQQS